MKKLLVLLALAALMVPGFAMAFEGDPCMRYGFGQADGLPFNQPGNDFADMYPGQTVTYTLAPMNMTLATYTGAGCTAQDTFCFEASSATGWTLLFDPPEGQYQVLPAGGYIWYQALSIVCPPTALVGDKDTIIALMAYTKTVGGDTICAPELGDCFDPNCRISNGQCYYNADTLIVTVVPKPPVIEILQDTLTLVDQGQTQAYIPFSICNPDETADPRIYDYTITSPGGTGGRIPAISTSGTTASINGGTCKDVYAVIDAGTSLVCDYATLTIIAWIDDPEQGLVYDTCVQRIHVVEPQPVPLFTVPVVTILVLALILAAAVFMRRRAVSRA
jgi:hypothetical protein